MLIDTKTEPVKLITFGAGGDTVYYSRGSYSQGYGTPENPHAANPTTKNIPDGTPVVDTTAAGKTREGIAWAIKGPLVNVDLAEGECAPLEIDKDSLVAGAAAATNRTFAFLLALQMVAKHGVTTRGPLDHVSIAEYAHGWKEHGARIGHYEAGKIVWHD
jgi:hypothetical protein